MMFEELLNKLNKPYNYNVIVSKIGSGRIVESGTFEKLEDAVAYKNRLVEKLVNDEEVRLEDMKGNPVSENKVVEQEPIKVNTDINPDVKPDVKPDDGFPRDEIGIANMIDAYIEDCDKADLVNLYNFITGLELTIDDVNWNMSEQVRKNKTVESYGKSDYGVKKYKVKVKHDSGNFTILTAATSEQAAKDIICKAEGCPVNSIISVTEIK